MTTELAREIYETISRSSCKKPYLDVLKKSVAYAHHRAEWALADREMQGELDGPRTIAHNSLIDCIHILARTMAQAGEQTGWYNYLKDSRYEIGEFACWIHWYLSVRA